MAFGVFSCGVIGRKLLLDYNQVRCSCVGMGIMTVVLGVANALRIPSMINETIFDILQSAIMVLFVDLLIAITFSLAGKFYEPEKSRNSLQIITIVATVLVNILGLLSILTFDVFNLGRTGMTMITATQLMCLVAVFLSYCYAFYPVVKMRIDVNIDNTPLSVEAIGTW